MMALTKKKKIMIAVIAAVTALLIAAGIIIPIVIINANKEKTLSEAYKDYFRIGVALDVDQGLMSFPYDDEFVSQFNSITAGNEMKWKYTENSKGEYTYELGDFVVEKAKSLGMVVRGHALVWRDSTPDYVVRHSTEDNAKAKVLDDIRSHIFNTVTHFGDETVYCWDVVNEAISDSGNADEIYYPCPLYNAAGEDYIFEAFKYARQANPNIKLYYNDYNLNQPVKRAKAIAMIKKMQSLGIPIDGIGEQGHYNIRNFDFEEFRRMFDDFRQLGLDVQITELDFSVYESDGDSQFDYLSDELALLQAEAYGKVMQICRENSDIVKGVTFWGGADDKTWLDDFPVKNRKNYPLLFDEFVDRKPAYDAVMNLKNTYTLDKDKAEDSMYNVYDGKSDEFHIGNWYGDLENSGFTVEDNFNYNGQSVTKVHYSKLSEYTEIVAKMTGNCNRFKYLNFKLSADAPMLMMAQLNYYIGYDGETNDKLIGEESFDVTAEPTVFSIRIPDSKRLYLNLLDEIWLFPEPGDRTDVNGKIMRGNFYIYDSWFSETASADAKVIEPNVSSSGVSEKSYKKSGELTWYNETSWSKIKLNRVANGMQIVSSGAADWAFVSVQLSDFKLTDNKIKISFYDPDDTVTYFRFRLRGTPTGMTNDGINTYMTYYDKDLVDFVVDPAFKDGYVKPANGWPERIDYDPATGRYDLYYNIGEEVDNLSRRGGIDLSDDGYGLRLVIIIETVGRDGKTGTDYAPKYPNFYSDEEVRGEKVEADKKFNIIVAEVKTYGDEE